MDMGFDLHYMEFRMRQFLELDLLDAVEGILTTLVGLENY
jgi:hypothetical protein